MHRQVYISQMRFYTFLVTELLKTCTVINRYKLHDKEIQSQNFTQSVQQHDYCRLLCIFVFVWQCWHIGLLAMTAAYIIVVHNQVNTKQHGTTNLINTQHSINFFRMRTMLKNSESINMKLLLQACLLCIMFVTESNGDCIIENQIYQSDS